MFDNPAVRKKMKKPERKQRKRLSFDSFLEIHRHAPAWMKIAMELALQTTQARLEITRIRYSIKEPKDGICGCVWLKEPVNGIYGTLYIHHQKTQHKEASHVAIPIGEAIKQIIDASRDNIISPFIVHRLPDKNSNPLSKEVSHQTQVAPDYLSRTFSIIRDKLGLYDDLSLRERPTFHEIRALAARMLQDQGYNPQARMAHSDEKSTRIYTENHRDWVHVPHVEIKINKIK